MEGVTEVPFKFEYDSTSGKYGYRDGADTFRPFNDGSGGATPVSLWTNSSPNSSFAAQTIAYDRSKYKSIVIKFKQATNNNTINWAIFSNTYEVQQIPIGQETYDGLRRRTPCYLTIAGIYIGNCINPQGGQYNNNIIPLNVYGFEDDLLAGI